MAPVEQHPDTVSEVRPGSVGSRTSTLTPSALRSWAEGPWAKVFAKAAGIGLLMLGLGGIGALAMAQGLTTHNAPVGDSSARRASAQTGWASQASLAGALSLASPASSGPAPAASEAPSDTSKAPSGLTADGRVILNLASADELRKLPGVGQKRAEAILALRQKLGKFRRPSDLLRIRGIGPKRLKQMLPKLLIDPPKETPTTAPSASPSSTPAPAPAVSG